MTRLSILVFLYSISCVVNIHASFKAPSTLKEAIERRQAKRDETTQTYGTPNEMRTKKQGDVFYITLNLVRMGISSFPMEAFKRFQKTRNLTSSSPLPYNNGQAARNTNTPFRVVLGPRKKYVVFIDDYFDLMEDHTRGATTIPVRIVRDDSSIYDEHSFWSHLRDDGLVHFTRPRPATFIKHSPGVSGDMSLLNFNIKQHFTLYAQDIFNLANQHSTVQTITDDIFLSNLAALFPKITVYTQPPFLRVYGYVPYPAAVWVDPRVHDVDEAIKSGATHLDHDKNRDLSSPNPVRSGHRPPPNLSTFERIKGFFSFSTQQLPMIDTLLQDMAPVIQYYIERDEVARNNPRERDPAVINRPDLRILLTENLPQLDKDHIARLQEIINEAYHQGDFNHIPHINKVLKRLSQSIHFDKIDFRNFIDTHQQLEVYASI